jgi:hypothetical protein
MATEMHYSEPRAVALHVARQVLILIGDYQQLRADSLFENPVSDLPDGRRASAISIGQFHSILHRILLASCQLSTQLALRGVQKRTARKS